MSRTVRLPHRVLVPVVAALAAVVLVSGCAAGQISQTANQVAAIDGGNGTIGQIGVRNALLATPTGADYAKGADAPLLMWVSTAGLNSDTLTAVSTPAAASVQINGTATVPGQSLADFTGSKVTFTLKDLTSTISYGESIPVTFAFASAGSLTVNVPVAIPAERTTGRPQIDIEPTEGASLWESSAQGSAAGG